MKNKALKITLIVLISLLIFVLLLLAILKVGERLLFKSFFSNVETEFKVPGISDGFVQQGFDYYSGDPETEEDDRFLVSGYMKAKENEKISSRIYVLDKDGKALSHTKLQDEKGQIYTGHAGGIASNGQYLYVTNDDNDENSINVFPLEAILEGKENVKMLGSVYVYLKPAFCYIHNGVLYTGNFHKDDHEKYQSPEMFIMGEKNTAIMLSFELDSQNADNFGVRNTPSEAYSITSQAQGMCIADDKLVLSTSWSINPSYLYVYDLKKISERGTIPTPIFMDKEKYGDRAMNKPIQLHIITDEDLIKEIKAPPMAEELVYKDGKVLIMNESASKKYIFGRFTSGNNIYGYIID